MSYVDQNFVPAGGARSPRQRRLIRARLTDNLGATYDLIVRNISEKGLGASIQGALPLNGASINFNILPGMAMSGIVRWVAGTALGVEFDVPIDVETVTQAIQRKHETAKQAAHWEVCSPHQVETVHPDPSKLRKI